MLPSPVPRRLHDPATGQDLLTHLESELAREEEAEARQREAEERIAREVAARREAEARAAELEARLRTFEGSPAEPKEPRC